MENFKRLTRLPPYVFNITSELKTAARNRGEDIIDFGMGNPDGATPKFIVDKLIEAVQKTRTHRYSLSKGIPRLRKAITNWYRTRYDVDLDPEKEAMVHIAGFAALMALIMLVAFHDIASVRYPGVAKVWNEVKFLGEHDCLEFTDQYDGVGASYMGLGVAIRKDRV